MERAVAEKELAQQAHAAAPSASGQVVQVGGKAFVQRKGVWVDTTYDPTAMQVVRAAFGSDRYFQLLREQPELGPYLSLGQYVVVALEGKAYVISDAGQEAEEAPVATAKATTASGANTRATTIPAALAPPATRLQQALGQNAQWILWGVGALLLAGPAWVALAARHLGVGI